MDSRRKRKEELREALRLRTSRSKLAHSRRVRRPLNTFCMERRISDHQHKNRCGVQCLTSKKKELRMRIAKISPSEKRVAMTLEPVSYTHLTLPTSDLV